MLAKSSVNTFENGHFSDFHILTFNSFLSMVLRNIYLGLYETLIDSVKKMDHMDLTRFSENDAGKRLFLVHSLLLVKRKLTRMTLKRWILS